MLNRLRWSFLLWLGALFVVISARAQSGASAVLTPPQTDKFPTISTFLDVRDAQGKFVRGLHPADIRVLEDSQSLPILALEELRPGAQLVVTVNPGHPFAIRDSQGVSRFDLLVQAIGSWARSRQGSTLDDYSLLAAGTNGVTHTPDGMELLSALESYQSDARSANPGLDILLQALDVAADPTPRQGMERAILFITAPIEGDLASGMQNLIARAREQNVRIHVWLVASADVFDSPSAAQLNDLASQTAGQFFPFSGTEAVPSLEVYLEPLRDIYRITYESKINQGGAHQLAAEIGLDGETIQTASQTFTFDLLPPDPAFISPTLEIERKYTRGGIRSGSLQEGGPGELYPKEHHLEVLVDFPDGHPRPLVRSILYVDGRAAIENTEPPFDQFRWDLSGITASGQHLLRVEVLDSMGLTGSSIETPFQVRVETWTESPMAFFSRYGLALSALAVLLSGAVGFLALILGGRLRPNAFKVSRRLRRRLRKRPTPAAQTEPVKAGLSGLPGADKILPGWVNRLQWPQRRLAPKAFAFLTCISDSGPAGDASVPIPITASELTFGKDPSQATLVLDDPSVESLHARLVRNDDGSFRIADEGSVAGTWVNYSPISREGAALEHGDLLHVGRVGFRFIQRDPPCLRRPVVVLKEPTA